MFSLGMLLCGQDERLFSFRSFSCDIEASFFELFEQFFWFRVPLSPFSADVFCPAVIVICECFFAFSFERYFCIHFSVIVLC